MQAHVDVCAYVMLTPANTCSNTPGRTGKLYLWLGFSLGMWAPDSPPFARDEGSRPFDGSEAIH